MKIDKIYSYTLSKRKKAVKGVLLYRGSEIDCIINNPIDYLIDGITFINRTKIKASVLEEDNLLENILNKKFKILLKSQVNIENFKFENFKSFFQFLKTKNSLCELSLSKEGVVYLAKVINVYEDSVDVDFYDTKFALLDEAYIKFKDITTVTILSDYVNTFQMLVKR